MYGSVVGLPGESGNAVAGKDQEKSRTGPEPDEADRNPAVITLGPIGLRVKLCPRCGGAGPFGRDRSRADGLSVYCMPCKARGAVVRRIGISLRGQESRTDQTPLMQAARHAVHRAVHAGHLERKDDCEWCGRGPTEAHHYAGYERDVWLLVKWLCRSCHITTHKRGWAA